MTSLAVHIGFYSCIDVRFLLYTLGLLGVCYAKSSNEINN